MLFVQKLCDFKEMGFGWGWDQLFILLTVICDCRDSGVAVGVIVILLVILFVGLFGIPLVSECLFSCTGMKGLVGVPKWMCILLSSVVITLDVELELFDL